MYIITTN